MLWIMIKKELLINLLSFRFLLIFLLCSILILVSFVTKQNKYLKQVEEYYSAVNTHKQELVEGSDQGIPGSYKLDKRPIPLSVFVEGMESSVGKYAAINILTPPSLQGIASRDPLFAQFGTLDLAFIVRVVLSLVTILLIYDAICGERERGTLKLVLSQAVPKHIILLAKCIGNYLTLLIPLILPLLLGLLIIFTTGEIYFSGEDWCRLGLIVLTSLLYLGVFMMLGLLVSIKSKSSSTALMMLLFIWVIIVLAVPKASMIAADKLSNVPSVQTVQAEKDAGAAQVRKEAMEKMKRYREEHPQILNDPQMNNVRRTNLLNMQAEMGLGLSKIRWELQNIYDRKRANQFRLAANISRISPAAVFTYAVTAFAGTGFERQKKFLDAARTYQIGFSRYYYDVFNSRRFGGRYDINQLPTFEFKEAHLSESWNVVWLDLLILFSLCSIFFMLAYVGFIRSDVR